MCAKRDLVIKLLSAFCSFMYVYACTWMHTQAHTIIGAQYDTNISGQKVDRKNKIEIKIKIKIKIKSGGRRLTGRCSCVCVCVCVCVYVSLWIHTHVYTHTLYTDAYVCNHTQYLKKPTSTLKSASRMYA